MNPRRPLLSRSTAAAILLLAAAARASTPEACDDSDSLRVLSQDFSGIRTTRPEVAQRELRNRQGETFSCAKWRVEQAGLEDLDIFSEVALKTEKKDGGIALTYVFCELPPYIPFIAVSITDQDGLSAGPAMAALNFLGLGIRAEFIARFGGTTEAQASLSSGRLGAIPLRYDLAAIRVASFNDFEEFHEDSWRIKLDAIHGMGEYGLPEAAHLIYAGELFYLENTKDDSAVLLDGNGDYVPRLGGGVLWDSRDRRHLPRSGLYQEFRFTQNGGFLGGEADYREWLSDTRVYLPWLPRNLLVLGNLYQYRSGVIGETFGRYDRFHVGGINTLRGYGKNSFQGKSEMLSTVENRIDLVRKRTLRLWKWGAFYAVQGIVGLDGASLWNGNSLFGEAYHTSWFTGLDILVAGVDRIRFEVGSKTAKFELQADLGILDKADAQRFRAR
jgi:outer membrane protein assembly factor BamA